MKAVVFDLDGTLVDSHRDIAAALNDVLRSLGKATHDPETVKRMIGGGVGMLLERGLGSKDIAEARARFKAAYFERLLETTVLYDGVRSMLEELQAADFQILIATNKPSFFTRPVLEHLDLPYTFASADEVPERKPDPAVVALALRRAGDPAAVAYVGDMPVDVQTAKNAELLAIGVTWGFDPEGMRASGPDLIADHPGKVGQLVSSGDETS